MDEDSSTKFIGSLTKFLQSLCNGYVEFQRGVELVGHIYLSIDTGEKVDYILHERVSKNDENSVTFVSNSFHAQPLDKDKETKDKANKDTPSKLDAKGSEEAVDDDDGDDDDIMIMDPASDVIGSTNTGSASPRAMKRVVPPGSDHRPAQRPRFSSAQSQNSSSHPFTSINRQHSGRPSATVTSTSQGPSQNDNISIADVKLEQISRDELLSLASQVGEGATGPPQSSSSASRSQPQHSSNSRGDAPVWVKQEVTDDGGGGSDAGWSQERDDSNSNSGSNLYPVMMHQNPAAFSSSSYPGFSGPGTSGNQSAANPFPMPGTSQDMNNLDPSEKMGWTRRCRTSFTQSQISTLEKEFDQGQYLTRPRRYYLAKKLNLTERHVTIWFQNRRQKLKKEQNQGPGDKDFSSPSQPRNQPQFLHGLSDKDYYTYMQSQKQPMPSPQDPGTKDFSGYSQSPKQSPLHQGPSSKDSYSQSPRQSPLCPGPGGKDANSYGQSPNQSLSSQSPGDRDVSGCGQSPSASLLPQGPADEESQSPNQPLLPPSPSSLQ